MPFKNERMWPRAYDGRMPGWLCICTAGRWPCPRRIRFNDFRFTGDADFRPASIEDNTFTLERATARNKSLTYRWDQSAGDDFTISLTTDVEFNAWRDVVPEGQPGNYATRIIWDYVETGGLRWIGDTWVRTSVRPWFPSDESRFIWAIYDDPQPGFTFGRRWWLQFAVGRTIGDTVVSPGTDFFWVPEDEVNTINPRFATVDIDRPLQWIVPDDECEWAMSTSINNP